VPGRRPVVYDHAREAAKEKVLSTYIELKCGHVTTWEIDELYSVWRPAKYRFYCEKCDKYTARAPKRKIVYPSQEETLF
jgi:hypothetical protein